MVTFIYLDNTLVLPSPELGDEEVLELKTQIDRSKNGTIYAYRTSPPTTKFELEFRNMNRPKVEDAKQFFIKSAGHPVQYIDYKGSNFTVAILNDPWVDTHSGIHQNSFSLEVEVLPS